MNRILAVAALSTMLTGAACKNPADGKPKAKVEEAAATPRDKPAAEAPETAKSYTVALADSKLGFTGSKVTGSHDGGFKQFSATATPADGKAEGGTVNVEIDVGSMFTDNDKLTEHLKSPDFFSAEKHPKAKFASTEIKAGGSDGHSHTITGNLTLHGVTKKITFPATVALTEQAATVKSEFAINRKDFGMAYAGKADDLIRDEVVIKLDLKLTAAA